MPNPAVKTFDPKMVVITWGVIAISGYAEGSFVRVNRSGDAFAKSKGAGGDIERINRNQGDFDVSLTLQQTSSTNQELAAALAADTYFAVKRLEENVVCDSIVFKLCFGGANYQIALNLGLLYSVGIPFACAI